MQRACRRHFYSNMPNGLFPLPFICQRWVLPGWHGLWCVCLLQHFAINECHRHCDHHRRLSYNHYQDNNCDT